MRIRHYLHQSNPFDTSTRGGLEDCPDVKPQPVAQEAQWLRPSTGHRVVWVAEIARTAAIVAALVRFVAAATQPLPRYGPDQMTLVVSSCVLLALFASYLFVAPVRIWPVRALRRKHPECTADAVGVRIRLSSGELELGRDRGLLWERDGVLHFEGLSTRFAIGKADLKRLAFGETIIDSHLVQLGAAGHLLSIHLGHLRSADQANLRQQIARWNSTSDPTNSIVLPPSAPRPRELSWFLARTIQRSPIASLTLVGTLLLNEVLIGAGTSPTLRYRIVLLAVAGCLHYLGLTYRRVRGEDVLRIREYERGLETPDLPERSAEEMSVGVRLNSL